jgi:hypothetical protein
MPDFSVEEKTHVHKDHPFLPPVVSKSTTVTDVRPNTVDAVGPNVVSTQNKVGRPGGLPVNLPPAY